MDLHRNDPLFMVSRESLVETLTISDKLGRIFPMVVVSIPPHAEVGPNDHRKDAPHFSSALVCFELFGLLCRDQDFYSIIPKVILFDGKYKKTSIFDFWIKILVQNHIQGTYANRRM